jgi:hypothetical protein
MQLYGLYFYFATEHLDGYSHVEEQSFRCLYFYYWGMNLLWLFIPGLLLIQSGIHISRIESDRRKVAPVPQYNGGIVSFLLSVLIYSYVFGVTFLLSAALFSNWVDKTFV